MAYVEDKYIEQAISDFDSIENAIVENGIEVPHGTDTKEYGKLIGQACKKQYDEGYSAGVSEQPEMYLLVDETGQEYPAVLVDEEVSFDATANDIREGKLAATDSGVTVGTKVIPSYNTSEGYAIITPQSKFTLKTLIKADMYDFTKLQIIICPYSESVSESVVAEMVVINEKVYLVNSNEVLATVKRDSINKMIDLGITNESESLYLIRYFTYKEIY